MRRQMRKAATEEIVLFVVTDGSLVQGWMLVSPCCDKGQLIRGFGDGEENLVAGAASMNAIWLIRASQRKEVMVMTMDERSGRSHVRCNSGGIDSHIKQSTISVAYNI